MNPQTAINCLAPELPCTKGTLPFSVEIPSRRIRLGVLITFLIFQFVASAFAQNPSISAISDYRNQLYHPAPASPVGTSLTQPASIVLISGHVGASGDPATPTSGQVQMLQSLIGQSTGIATLPFLYPGIALLSPGPGAAFADTADIPLVARAWDLDDRVANIIFYATGSRTGTNLVVGFVSNELPLTNDFTATWHGANWGTVVITAVATDIRGQKATSAPVEITITAVPQIWIVNPRLNEEFIEQTEVPLTAIAYDPDSSIDFVDFFANGRILGRAFGETNAPNPIFEFLWTNAPLGSHALHAEVHDRYGPATVSTPVNILVGTTNTNSVTIAVSPHPVVIPALGILQVFLEPTNIAAQWRFEWEYDWRDSGALVSGLPGGDYPMVFKPVAGYITPETYLAPVQPGTNNVFAFEYTNSVLPQLGLLTIHIAPPLLANDPDDERRAQWRRVGETNWHDSGETNYWLPSGSYEIEFKRVSAFWNTPNRILVPVRGNWVNSANARYSVANRSGGVPPSVLSFEEIQNSYSNGLSFANCGQILSPIGWSSGSVIKPRVVLTVAHGLFDTESFSFVSPDEVGWFFQRHAEVYEPPPVAPRGWCIHSGYAALRKVDHDPGIASEDSQKLDIAVLYFLDAVGSTTNSQTGYLVSRSPNELWLNSNPVATLVGYPVESIDLTNRGRMHATPTQAVTFDHVSGPIYHTTEIKGFPGNSGGPLCVQYTNGIFYPAGIYLGGSTRTIIRAIDDMAIALIACAEKLSNGDDQGTGGGPIRVRECTDCTSSSHGYLNVIVLPPEMTNHGASYRFIRNITNVFQFDGYSNQFAMIEKKAFTLEFYSAGPFAPPLTRSVEAANGVTNTVVAQFRAWGELRPVEAVTDKLWLLGTVGSTYRLEYTNRLVSKTNWPVLSSFLLTNSTRMLTIPVHTGTRFYRAVLQP